MAERVTSPHAGTRLRLTEIFYSLQGESRSVGIPTVFIRLTGCPLRCVYCDTSYAFTGGDWWELPAILAELEKYRTEYVTVTGGEPLAQKACRELLHELCERGYKVSLETSGAIDISGLDPRVIVVMDLKAPGSGELDKNLYDNIAHLQQHDQVKFVLSDRRDYEWATGILNEYHLPERCEVLMSPVHEQLPLRDLAEWVLADQLPVRVQMQLHKAIWGDTPGH